MNYDGFIPGYSDEPHYMHSIADDIAEEKAREQWEKEHTVGYRIHWTEEVDDDYRPSGTHVCATMEEVHKWVDENDNGDMHYFIEPIFDA